METGLQKKAQYEFNLFYYKKITDSKAAIFSSSYEIEVKKRIYDLLMGGTIDAKTENILLNQQSLIDLIYSRMESRKLDSSEAIMACIDELINSM